MQRGSVEDSGVERLSRAASAAGAMASVDASAASVEVRTSKPMSSGSSKPSASKPVREHPTSNVNNVTLVDEAYARARFRKVALGWHKAGTVRLPGGFRLYLPIASFVLFAW